MIILPSNLNKMYSLKGAKSYKVQVTNGDDEIIISKIVFSTDNEKQKLLASNLNSGIKYQVDISSIDKFDRQSKEWSSPTFFTTSMFV